MVDALVEAATQVFSQTGFEKASTNAIAEHAGASIGSLYQYFPDKRALLQAVNESYAVGLWLTASRASRNACDLPWAQALRSIVAAIADYYMNNSRLFGILQDELPATYPTGVEADLAKLQLERELRNFLVAHQATVRIAIDRAVQMLPVVAKGVLATSFLSRPDDLKSGRLIDEVTRVLSHYLTDSEIADPVIEISEAH